MIRTRIAGAAAIVTFGLAGLGGAVVALAAPAHADSVVTVVTVDGTHMAGTAGPAVEDADTIPNALEDATRGPNVTVVPAPGTAATQQHVPFPHSPAPHSEHDGQGKKGGNGQPHPNLP